MFISLGQKTKQNERLGGMIKSYSQWLSESPFRHCHIRKEDQNATLTSFSKRIVIFIRKRKVIVSNLMPLPTKTNLVNLSESTNLRFEKSFKKYICLSGNCLNYL